MVDWHRFTPSDFEYDFERDELGAHDVTFLDVLPSWPAERLRVPIWGARESQLAGAFLVMCCDRCQPAVGPRSAGIAQMWYNRA